MDDVDKKIVLELMKNSRIPFSHVAKKLGISSFTVQQRFEKMKKEGAILGTFTIIDVSKLGFQGKIFLFVSFSKNYDLRTMVKKLFQFPNVFLVSEVIGRFDLLVMSVFRNISEVKELVKKIDGLQKNIKIEFALTDDTYYPIQKEYTEINPFE